MDQRKIGKFIAENRKEKGLTQAQFSEAIGVSDRTVSKWENGHGIPELSLLEPVAEFFEISVSELLSGEKTLNKEKNADKKILEILKENLKERKNKKVIVIITSIIIIIMILIVIFSFSKIKDLEDTERYFVYKNGVYTNNLDIEFTVDEVRILNFLGKLDEDIKNMTEEEKTLQLQYYYAELETFRMYGFSGEFSGSKEVDNIRIINLVKKRTTPFVLSEGVEVHEEYCYLGTSKNGSFLLSEYKKGNCYTNDIVCSYAKEKGANLKVDISKYCN